MSILSKLQALLTAANTKTGESDTTLTDAMQTLVDGYGQGGGAVTGTFSVEENTTTSVKITDLGTIGFTPSIFLLYSTIRHTTESTQNGLILTGIISIGESPIKFYERYSNTTGGRSSSSTVEDWTGTTTGYPYLSNYNIFVKAFSSVVLLGGETYNWIAL